MQPPDTEPTTAPSSRMAMMEPTGRGDEPHVRTTVANKALCPATRQSRNVRNTVRSRLSMNTVLKAWSDCAFYALNNK